MIATILIVGFSTIFFEWVFGGSNSSPFDKPGAIRRFHSREHDGKETEIFNVKIEKNIDDLHSLVRFQNGEKMIVHHRDLFQSNEKDLGPLTTFNHHLGEYHSQEERAKWKENMKKWNKKEEEKDESKN